MNERDLLQAGFRYGLSLCHSRPDAEDLVQEAWLRLHRRGAEVRDKSLLFTVIRNLYFDRFRRDKVVAFAPLVEVTERASEDPPLDGRVTADDLEGPLKALRDEEREALFLQAVEGYTAEEIARMTGRPRGTVLSLIHRAKHKLRKALAPDRNDPPMRRHGFGTEGHD